MSDVRSLEEVIAAEARNQHISLSVNVAGFAAAVREWCLAPEQIQIAEDALRVNSSVLYRYPPGSFVNSVRAALHAVMGDTP